MNVPRPFQRLLMQRLWKLSEQVQRALPRSAVQHHRRLLHAHAATALYLH